MANAPKMDFSSFQTQLKQGRYETGTAARRAVGRAIEFSAADKASAHELINKKFGVPAAAKNVQSAKKTSKIVKKAAISAAPEKPKGKPGRPKGYSPKSKKVVTAVSLASPPSYNTQLQQAAMIMSASTDALKTVTESKKNFSGVDFNTTAQRLNETLLASADVFKKFVGSKENQVVVQNGRSAGEVAFSESAPLA